MTSPLRELARPADTMKHGSQGYLRLVAHNLRNVLHQFFPLSGSLLHIHVFHPMHVLVTLP